MRKIIILSLIFFMPIIICCKRTFNDHEKEGAIMLAAVASATSKLQQEANFYIINNTKSLDDREESVSLYNNTLLGKLKYNFIEITFVNYNIGNNIILNNSVTIHRENPGETIYNGEINIEGFKYCSNIKFSNCIVYTDRMMDILFRIRGEVIIDGHIYKFRRIFSALNHFSINNKWD